MIEFQYSVHRPPTKYKYEIKKYFDYFLVINSHNKSIFISFVFNIAINFFSSFKKLEQ